MKPIVLLFTLAFIAGSPLRADEITETLKAAYTAYTEKELSTATEKTREALKLLEAKSADLMQKSILPDKIDKWAGETVQNEKLDFAGGGVSLKRVYKNGKKAAAVLVVKDSPLVNGIMKLLGNDDFLTLSNARTERVSGHTGIVNEKPLKLSIVVAERVLVELTPVGDETDDHDLISLARKLDYKTLEKLSR